MKKNYGIKRKYKRISTLLALLIIMMITAFYAKGAILPDKSTPVALDLRALRDPAQLITLAEKNYLVENGLKNDFRPENKIPVKVKGIYMSGAVFNSSTLFNRLVSLVEETELNAIVIDMKDDNGYLTTNLDIDVAREIKARSHKGIDIKKNMKLLSDKNIYPIARIVVFKDPTLAEGKQELAIKTKDGRIWRNRRGLAWVDPHNKEVWKYAVDVAKEAAKLGFKEIQFDYVRFPTDGNMKNVVYPYADGKKKEDVIKEFLKYAQQELQPYNVYLAADVFGLTTLTVDDMGMGQKFEKVMEHIDYICPMVYPSHYGPGNYGFSNPNANPYGVVNKALLDGLEKAEDSSVIIRPWLQDFTLGKPAYGAAEVRAQIKATYDAGLEEWILWNASNRYTRNALLEG